MGLTELLFIAVGLSMDAFAVAICKGLSMKKASLGKMVIVGLYFGIFQAGMPLVGYLVGMQFERYITSIDHWIAFILLAVIGFNMIREALKGGGEKEEADLGFKAMLPLALATSIDALAVGVTFAFLQTNIVPAVSFIGIITFTLSAVGVKIGNLFGGKLKSKAEIFGGVILIAIGLKILLEHLGVF